MKRSFQSLSPQEALHVAIFVEERNSDIYFRFAEMFVSFRDFASLEMARALWDMAVEEYHHSSFLQERYIARYGLAACALTEDDILEINELPELMDGVILDSAVDMATAHDRALRVSLIAENETRGIYAELAQTADDPQLQALCVELFGFEGYHEEFLERELANSAPCH
jgi:rubrerythrin